MADYIGILAVILRVGANGFFVAAEFALVSVLRSRVAELVAEGRANAKVLQRAVEHLDSNLAATQLGITISSLALGWVGEPALSHLIEPWLDGFRAIGLQAARMPSQSYLLSSSSPRSTSFSDSLPRNRWPFSGARGRPSRFLSVRFQACDLGVEWDGQPCSALL